MEAYPMHFAVKSGQKDRVKYYFDQGISVNSCDDKKYTPLHYAAANGHLLIAEFLINNKCNMDIEASDGNIPLLLAVRNGHKTIVELLVNSGANLKICNNSKWTLLHYASEKGWLEIVQSCLKKKCDVNLRTCDGNSPLLLATENNHTFIIKLLVNSGADLKAYNSRKWTVLHHASCNGSLDLVQYLLDKECDVNAKALDGTTAFMLAARNCRVAIFELLIKSGINIKLCDSNKWTPLHYASHSGWSNLIQMLARKRCDLNAKTSAGNTPLMLAVKNNQLDAVRLLVCLGANIKFCDSRKWTLLHYASDNGWLELVKKFVEKKKYDLNVETSLGSTPLSLAAKSGHEAVVKLLINAGAKSKFCDSRKWTLLHYACDNGWLDIVQFFVEKGHDLDLETSSGSTPLMLAARNDHQAVVKLLVDSGAKLDFCDSAKWTLLHYAANGGWFQLVQTLVERKYNLNVETLDGSTALILAAYNDNENIANLLVEAGANVNVFDLNRITLLHIASLRGWQSIVLKCIEVYPDINVRCLGGQTALYVACYYGQEQIIRLLLNAGSNCNIRDNLNESALHCFLENEMKLIQTTDEMISLFINFGAHFEQVTLQKYPVLIYTNIFRDVELCTQALINKFNYSSLPSVYSLPGYCKNLPSITRMEIKNNSNVEREIKKCVAAEIDLKGYCNVVEASPIVLKMMCVKFLAK